MGFNKFSVWDFLRILAVLVILGLFYLGLSNTFDWQFGNRPGTPVPDTPEPEPTSTNTPTPRPTSTAVPTSTPEPSPTPMVYSQLLNYNQTITYWNEFDNTDPVRGDWYMFPNVVIEDGLVVIEATENWDGVYGGVHLEDNDAILVKFRFSELASFYIMIESGEWLTDSYKSWGIGSDNGEISPVIADGSLEYFGTFSKDLYLTPDHWYFVLLYIGGEENYRLEVWDFAEKMILAEFSSDMGERWVGQEWSPSMIVGSGYLEIDRYEEINNLID